MCYSNFSFKMATFLSSSKKVEPGILISRTVKCCRVLFVVGRERSDALSMQVHPFISANIILFSIQVVWPQE